MKEGIKKIVAVIFGIGSAALILLILIGCTMIVYGALRKKYPQRKILNEILVMGVAILVSLVARFVTTFSAWDALFAKGSFTFGKSTAAGMEALYSFIGGMSFEGTTLAKKYQWWGWEILYYGSITYLGIIFLLIITARISYEWYSYCKLKFTGSFRKFKRYYIFTDVSEASLLTAISIDDKERKEKQEKKGKKRGRYAIIFTGNELEPIDRKSTVYRKLIDHSFYYWTYPKKANKQEENSLLKKFYKQKSTGKKPIDHNGGVYIFALKKDEEGRGLEDKNSDIIFDDIQAVLYDYYRGKQQSAPIINYYVLTRKCIDYQFYQRKVERLIQDFSKKHSKNLTFFMKDVERKGGESLEEAFSRQCLKYLQIRPLNEAQLTADHLIFAIQKEFLRETDTLTYLPYQKYMGLLPNNDPYKAVVFGFGEIGQYALKELCINTASLQEDKKTPKEFLAKVYDKNGIDRMGEFSYAHPLYNCFNGIAQEWIEAYCKRCKPSETEERQERKAEGEKMLGQPTVWFYQESCFSQRLMKKIDSTMGGEARGNDEVSSYIVSLGNDEDNLSFANLMLADRKHELWENIGRERKQIVFVHIRDEKNIARLNWTEQDCARWGEHLRVVAFGCRESIWSYDNIIDDDDDRIFHYVYKIISRGIDEEAQSTEEEKTLCDELSRKDGKSDQNIIRQQIEKIKKGDAYKDSWLSASIFDKESNRSVRKYAVNYFPYKRTEGDIEYFARLEKLRWNRFHMSHGWCAVNPNAAKELDKNQKDERKKDKEHPDLLEYDQTSEKAKQYDKCNVDLGAIAMIAAKQGRTNEEQNGKDQKKKH